MQLPFTNSSVVVAQGETLGVIPVWTERARDRLLPAIFVATRHPTQPSGFCRFGGRGRTRTCDLTDVNRAL